jgi:Recombination endonuclease VII
MMSDDERRKKAAKQAREYRAKNPEKARANWRKWAAANPDKVFTDRRRKQIREWAAANRGKRREYKYGVSQEAFDAILQTQNFRCAACKSDLRAIRSKHVHLDHCHDTGRIRGVLCHSCNMALGLMKEDSSRLKALAAYIEDFK